MLPRLLPLLLGAAAASQEAAVRSFAARGALAALADVDELEAELVAAEQAVITSGTTALDAYGHVQEAISLLLDTALAALRHAAAADVLQGEELGRAAALERQLAGLAQAQVKEPVFFWHGPKWMLLTKFRKVFAEDLRGRLAAVPRADGEIVESKAAVEAREGVVPAVGVAVGDAECGEGKPCELSKLLGAAKHVLVLPCSESAMRSIGKQLKAAKGLFVSVAFSYEKGEEGARGLYEAFNTALKALNRRSVDLAWFPYSAFKKQQWQGVTQLVAHLKQEKLVSAYGINAESRSSALTEKLLKREPMPAAWLTRHDLLRPADSDAVALAQEMGIAVVGLPRKVAAEKSALRALYAASRAPELRWTLASGLAAVVRPGREAEEAVAALGGAKLEERELGMLSALGAFCQPEVLKEGKGSLLAALANAKKEEGADPSPVEGVPSISASLMEDIEAQQREYKANNHVIYRQNFFDDATFAEIVRETKRLWRSEDIEANCNLDGVDRLGGYVLDYKKQEGSLYKLIYGNEALRKWVTAVNNEGEMWPADFPIELREYGNNSKGMMCHPDLQMYAVPKKDLEFVVTVDNNSSCNVTYTDAKNEKHVVHTTGNSLMMVRVNAAVHCVTPTVGGTRTILKFIYVGDYRKSSSFWSYTDNTCAEDNKNRQLVKGRRGESAETAETNLEL